MKSFLKRYTSVLPAMAAIAWLLPQSLFSDCVRPVIVEDGMYSVEKCQKIFDISEDEFEIVFGLKEIFFR